jgi:hypothetical protein
MGIIDELIAASGDKAAVEQLVDRCLDTPPVLHGIAEGLRTGTPKARETCIDVLARVGEKRPDLLGDFVNDLLDASRQRSKKIARLSLLVLVSAVSANPSAVFAEREHLLALARTGGPVGLAALKALATLCGSGANYRGKLVAPITRVLLTDSFADKDLARWLGAATAAFEGSPDGIKRLERDLQPRLARLSEADATRCGKVMTKLQRSAKRRR